MSDQQHPDGPPRLEINRNGIADSPEIAYIHIRVSPINGPEFMTNMPQAMANLLLGHVKFGAMTGSMRPTAPPLGGTVVLGR